MNLMGLKTVGENLAEQWSTDVKQSSTRADEISAWLANHAGDGDTYAIVDVEAFNQQVEGTCHEKHVVLIDSEQRSLSGLASKVGAALRSFRGRKSVA